MLKPEILSPVGDQERLEAAIRYGADAVYLGGTSFGMRAACPNFDPGGLKSAVEYAHAHDVRVYLTCNTLPTNEEVAQIEEFLLMARDAGVDALIVADVGILMLAKRLVPEVEIHISTQAGIVNYLTANELYKLGAKRVVLARELSLEQIRCIREHTPPDLEIEVFVHGAMCMSFSGRCLLSNYMVARDANRGECAQPCRWGYYLMEEKRPGQYYPIFEDEKGSYILNAKDLCMIEYIDQLVQAGVTSLKIEGRAKSAYYVSVVTGAYRAAVNEYLRDPSHYDPPQWILDEVKRVSHREYSTGFYFGRPNQCYQNAGYIRDWDVIAVVNGWEDGNLLVTSRNKFTCGEEAEVMRPGKPPAAFTISTIFDPDEGEVESARHPMHTYCIPCSEPFEKGAIIRRESKK